MQEVQPSVFWQVWGLTADIFQVCVCSQHFSLEQAGDQTCLCTEQCGKRKHPGFLEQKTTICFKPSLRAGSVSKS